MLRTLSTESVDTSIWKLCLIGRMLSWRSICTYKYAMETTPRKALPTPHAHFTINFCSHRPGPAAPNALCSRSAID